MLLEVVLQCYSSINYHLVSLIERHISRKFRIWVVIATMHFCLVLVSCEHLIEDSSGNYSC